MNAPSLVETKLQPPRRRRDMMRRTRLTDRLANAEPAAVVLVSAPAGKGPALRSGKQLARVEQVTKVCDEPGRRCAVGNPVVDGDRQIHDVANGDLVVDHSGLG